MHKSEYESTFIGKNPSLQTETEMRTNNTEYISKITLKPKSFLSQREGEEEGEQDRGTNREVFPI